MANAVALTPDRKRWLAVDVMRGLVLVVLLPDLAGGFSFYKVAEALPGNPYWAALAAQFRHVEWTGAAVWDLVMPMFVFVVGVSMALSYRNRRATGQTEAALTGHALIRSAALLLLGLLLQFRPESRVDELLPFLVLSIGLPIASGAAQRFNGNVAVSAQRIDNFYAVIVLAGVTMWMLWHYRQLGHYEIGSQILVLLGLSYMPAFLLQRWGVTIQFVAMVVLVALYGLAFVVFASVTGSSQPWTQGHNVASAFDAWFFPLLPRGEPYRGNPHDYHSLLVVPLVAAIAFGAIVGNVLAAGAPARRQAVRLAGVALCGLLISGLMSLFVAPLLKSLWTPTWSLFSSSLCLLGLAALMLACDERDQARWATPLVVLGTNSILLYVLAYTQGWRIERLLNWIVDVEWRGSLPWWPLLQSCLVLAVLWALAYALHRARVFVRI